MRSARTPQVAGPSGDAELVRRALTRDEAAFCTIMERHNRKLYRIARGIVRNDSEAEDVAFTGEAPSSGAASALYIFFGKRKKLQIAGIIRRLPPHARACPAEAA